MIDSKIKVELYKDWFKHWSNLFDELGHFFYFFNPPILKGKKKC